VNGLEVENLTFSYGQKQVLKNIHLSLEPGQVTAVIGPNGCGKSTLLKIICGIIYSGDIRFLKLSWNEQDLNRLGLRERVKFVSYLGSDLYFDFPITAFEAVMMGQIPHHPAASWSSTQEEQEQVKSAMMRTGCFDLRNRWMNELSGGEQQLVALARVLVQRASVVLLDETLSRMDLHHQVQAGKILRELAGEGKLVLIVSHDLNLSSEWSDTAVLMVEGTVNASGKLKEILTTERLKQLYPDTPLVLTENPSNGIPKVFFCRN
jgi:iron complex transport system ATP-binding protein